VAFNELLSVLKGMKDVSIAALDFPNLYIRVEFPAQIPPGSIDDVEFQLR
jgi:hypothetical protein